MTKINLNSIASLTSEQTAISSLAGWETELETQGDTFLSRDGTSPNQMLASLDMNSHRILNLPAPGSSLDPVRLEDLEAFSAEAVGFPLSTQVEAEAGESNASLMTPIRTAQATAAYVFPTKADLVAMDVPEDIPAVRTTGFTTAGDGGGALYLRVTVEPTHEFKVQDAGLAWWEGVPENGRIIVDQLGAKGDGTDCTDIINDTINAAVALRAPIVQFLGKTYRTDGQITVDGVTTGGITLAGVGCAQSSTNEATVLNLHTSTGPHITFGNETTRTDHYMLRDIHLLCSNGGAVPVIQSRYVRGMHFENITAAGVYRWMSVGTTLGNTSHLTFTGYGEITMRSAHEHGFVFNNFTSPGFLFGAWQIEGQNVAATYGLYFPSNGVRVDGFQILGWNIRQFDRLINFLSSGGNFYIGNTVLDNFGSFGIYADSTVDSITGFVVTGSHISTSTTAANKAIYIEKSTNVVRGININNCKISNCGAEAIHVTGAGFYNINGCVITDPGQNADNTYGALRIGTGAQGVFANNLISTTHANRHKYGIQVDTAADDVCVHDNVSVGHGTSGISNSNRGDATKRKVYRNTGQVLEGTACTCSFQKSNAAANTADQQMNVISADINGQGFRPPQRCRIVAIGASVNGTPSAGTATFAPYIEGASQAASLSVALDSGNVHKEGTYLSGIAVSAGAKVDVRVSTTVDWAATTLDVYAWLVVIYD